MDEMDEVRRRALDEFLVVMLICGLFSIWIFAVAVLAEWTLGG